MLMGKLILNGILAKSDGIGQLIYLLLYSKGLLQFPGNSFSHFYSF